LKAPNSIYRDGIMRENTIQRGTNIEKFSTNLLLIPTVSPRSTNRQQSTGRQSLTATADALAQYADKKTDHGLNIAMTANKLKTPQQ
jgi:hypothetical protein